MLVTILFLAVSVIFFVGMKFRREALCLGDSFSVDATTDLRGILALLIVLHHLSLQITFPGNVLFDRVGGYVVGLFFFLSGYGLMKRYTEKGSAYLKGFLPKHLMKLGIPLVITFAAALAVFGLSGIKTLSDVGASFVGFDPFPYHSWYIYATVYLYVGFYLVFRLFKDRLKAALIGLTVFILPVMCLFVLIGKWTTFTQTVLCFPFGCFAVLYEKELGKFKKYGIWLSAVLCVTLFGVSAFFLRSFTGTGWLIVNAVVRNLSAVMLALFVLYLSCRVKIGNRVLTFLGKHSLGVYLIHGTVYMGLKQIPWLYERPVLWAFLSLTFSVFFGFLLSRCSAFIGSRLTRKKV